MKIIYWQIVWGSIPGVVMKPERSGRTNKDFQTTVTGGLGEFSMPCTAHGIDFAFCTLGSHNAAQKKILFIETEGRNVLAIKKPP